MPNSCGFAGGLACATHVYDGQMLELIASVYRQPARTTRIKSCDGNMAAIRTAVRPPAKNQSAAPRAFLHHSKKSAIHWLCHIHFGKRPPSPSNGNGVARRPGDRDKCVADESQIGPW